VSNTYGFHLFAPAGGILVWCDIGSFVLRVDTGNTLGWLARVASKGDDECDYVLGKLVAADGPTKAFMRGDAFRYIDERAADDPALGASLRRRFHERLAGSTGDADDVRAWYEACHAHGIYDPASAEGWASGPLYLWHGLRVFARLHQPFADRARTTVAVMAAQLGAHDEGGHA